MHVYVIGSGSTGNAALVEVGETRVLVDAGLSPKVIARRLHEMGVELFPRSVDAIVISHQHGDHAGHLEPLLRALRCPVYLHRGIEAQRIRHRYQVRPLELDRPTRIEAGGGELTVEATMVPHDAPQVALRIASARHTFAIATDLGSAPDSVARFLGDADLALVEANHCPALLHEGPYPWKLKQRVAGDRGHLNNLQTADLAERMLGGRLSRLVLGHLSRANNDPALALHTVASRVARRMHVEVLPHGEPRRFDLSDPVPGREMRQIGLFSQSETLWR